MEKATTTDFTTEAMNHIRIIQSGMNVGSGFIELRSFPENGKNSKAKGNSFFIPAGSPTDDDISRAVKWAETESRNGRGVFFGLNPRVRESGSKSDVEYHSAAFLDLDIHKSGIKPEDAIAELKLESPIKPTYISESGGGLHAVYYFEPTSDYRQWEAVQETLYEKFRHLGADRAIVTDSSRVFRLTPFPNWKTGSPRRTRIVEFNPPKRTPRFNTFAELFDVDFSRVQGKSSGELPNEIVEGGTETMEGRNTLLFKEASRLRNRGYELDEIIPTLGALNRKRCKPPLTESEVERIAESAIRYKPTMTMGNSNDYDKLGVTLREFLDTDFPPVEWVIHGLNNGELGMIQAKPSIGKTTVLFNLALSMATGREFYPLYDGGTPRRVSYLDFENRDSFLKKDLQRMVANFDESEYDNVVDNLQVIADKEIAGNPLNLSNEEHLRVITDVIARHGSELVVIDTLAAAFTLANENDNSEAERVVIKPLKELARHTGAAILLVHHIGKAGDSPDKSKLYRGRGASAFAGASRLIIDMDSMKDGSGKQIANHVLMNCAKVKGVPFNDTAFQLDFSRRWFNVIDMELEDETSRYERIWSLVTGEMTRAEVVEAVESDGLNVSTSTVARAIKLGIQSGVLISPSHGRYAPNNTPGGEEIEGEVLFDGEQ